MLMEEAIRRARRVNKIRPFKPLVSWGAEERAFFMCVPLYQSIQAGKASTDEKDRKVWAQLEASISLFVEGGYINEDRFKQLIDRKREHWEMRVLKPRPSLRVFGRFALPNVFVGTHVKYRKDLGGMWSPQFEHEKLVCEEHWNDAGLPSPFTDPPDFQYESYITQNAHQKIRIPK